MALKIKAKLTTASLNIGSTSVNLTELDEKGQQFQAGVDSKPYYTITIITSQAFPLVAGKDFIVTIEETKETPKAVQAGSST
jgi:hypothetical protein